MRLTRPSRLITALIVLISMLFMQLAVAGYACPSFNPAPLSESMSMSMPMDGDQAMSGCENRDKSQPNLCHAHAQNANQSLDKSAMPHVPPFLPATLTLVFSNIALAENSTTEQPNALLLTRSTAPPLSIRNCCFRI